MTRGHEYQVSQVTWSLGPTPAGDQRPRSKATHTPPRAGPSPIRRGRKAALTNAPVSLSQGDCQVWCMRSPLCDLQPFLLRAPQDSFCLFYLQRAPAVSPFASRRRSKKVTNCARGLKASARRMSCSQGPKPAFGFLMSKPHTARAACPAGSPAALPPRLVLPGHQALFANACWEHFN